MKHLPYCGKTSSVRKLALRFIEAFGIDPANINSSPLLTYCFNLDARNEVWRNQAVLAVLRLYWRVVYRHMTRLEIDGTPFHPPTVRRALCRIFMEKFLNYQSERRTFYQNRRYTSRTEVLPLSAAHFVESIGDLDVHTGVFLVKDSIQSILEEYEEWTDFNSTAPAS